MTWRSKLPGPFRTSEETVGGTTWSSCAPSRPRGHAFRVLLSQEAVKHLVGPALCRAMSNTNGQAPRWGTSHSTETPVSRRRDRATRSGSDRRRFERHAPGAPHQEELEIDELGGAELVGLRADPDQASPQAALQGSQALPLQPVDRVPGGVRLGDDVAGELAAPVVVVALATGEIELALTTLKGRAAGVEERLRSVVDGDFDRRAT